jgi:hypothetical protein
MGSSLGHAAATARGAKAASFARKCNHMIVPTTFALETGEPVRQYSAFQESFEFIPNKTGKFSSTRFGTIEK